MNDRLDDSIRVSRCDVLASLRIEAVCIESALCCEVVGLVVCEPLVKENNVSNITLPSQFVSP